MTSRLYRVPCARHPEIIATQAIAPESSRSSSRPAVPVAPAAAAPCRLGMYACMCVYKQWAAAPAVATPGPGCCSGHRRRQSFIRYFSMWRRCLYTQLSTVVSTVELRKAGRSRTVKAAAHWAIPRAMSPQHSERKTSWTRFVHGLRRNVLLSWIAARWIAQCAARRRATFSVDTT